MLSTVYLTAEDEPGLAIGQKLIAEAPPLSVYRTKNARGYGCLKSKALSFQQMGANGLPVLMITDLDSAPCPSQKIDDWIHSPPSPGFLFRICVREVESWVLAHRAAVAHYLGLPIAQVTNTPESLRDPKAELIKLAQQSQSRKIRVGFKPLGSASIGPDYNNLLGEFIRFHWDPAIAEHNSKSLVRARKRIGELAGMIDQ